jgi:hypothetical protein
LGRFENGWVRLERKAVTGDIGQNANCLSLWATLLCWATRMETVALWNGEKRILPPGSVLMGLDEIAEQLKISRSTARRWITYLEKTERVFVESGNRGTLVTIRNWAKYQPEQDLAEHPEANRRPTDENPEANSSEPGGNLEATYWTREQEEQENKKNKRERRAKPAPELPLLAEIWNQCRGEMPAVRGCAKKRLREAQERWRENSSPEYWTEIITRMAKSDFLTGRKPSEKNPNWRADFDFLLQPETQNKVLEGKYDNRQGYAARKDPELELFNRQIEEEEEKFKRERGISEDSWT